MSYKDNPNNYTRCEKCKHIDRENGKCKITNDNWLVSDRAGTCHQFEGVESMWVKYVKETDKTFTKDKKYKVISEYKNSYSLVTDRGILGNYRKNLFKKIKNPIQVVEEFDVITKEMKDLYELKNKNYGNSFSLSYEEYGLTMVCIRLEDKLRRLKSLNKQGENANADDESIRDTLIDLANYSVMAIMELDK